METTYESTAVLDDATLMDGLIGRHPDALDALYRRYHSILKSIVMQVVHDDMEADDVMQEVFLQVWERADSYSSTKGRLVNWLATLARRRAIDRLRQQGAYRRATDRYETACNQRSKAFEEYHPVEREAQRVDLKEFLHEHLDALPAPQKQAIRMAFFELKSQREISMLTHTPLGTVKTRIELGIKKLAHAICGAREKLV